MLGTDLFSLSAFENARGRFHLTKTKASSLSSPSTRWKHQVDRSHPKSISVFHVRRWQSGTGKMAQGLRAVVLVESLSLIPSTHGRKLTATCISSFGGPVPFSGLCRQLHAHTCMHTRAHTPMLMWESDFRTLDSTNNEYFSQRPTAALHSCLFPPAFSPSLAENQTIESEFAI